MGKRQHRELLGFRSLTRSTVDLHDSFDVVFRCDSDLESKRVNVLGGEGQRRRAEPGQAPPSVLIITSTSSGKHMTRLA